VDEGATSTIEVTATGTAMQGAADQETPIVPRPDGTCPFGLVPDGGVCKVECTVSLPEAVYWIVRPITASLSARVEDELNATLTWETQNATTRRLQGPDIPGGSLTRLPKSGSFPVRRGPKDKIYTLTASAEGVETKTVTASVPAVEVTAFSVSITSPANNAQVASSTDVTVSGRVSPPGTNTAVITVNGKAALSAFVKPDGTFSADVPLDKRPPTATCPTCGVNLAATSPEVVVTNCAKRSEPVTVTNPATLAESANVITVTATDGSQTASASVTVVYAFQLDRLHVRWGGTLFFCPVFVDKTVPLNAVLGPQQSVTVDGVLEAQCTKPGGCPGASASGPLDNDAQVSVDTPLARHNYFFRWRFDTGKCS
jgi:hypothetical protein